MRRSREGSEAKKQQYEIIGDEDDEEFAHKNNSIPRSPQKFSHGKSREEKIQESINYYKNSDEASDNFSNSATNAERFSSRKLSKDNSTKNHLPEPSSDQIDDWQDVQIKKVDGSTTPNDSQQIVTTNHNFSKKAKGIASKMLKYKRFQGKGTGGSSQKIKEIYKS